MPKTPQDLFAFLDSLGIATRTVSHVPVFTVAEARAARAGHDLEGTHLKNLFLRDKKGNMWLVVVREDRRVDLKRLAQHLGVKNLSFGTSDRLLAYLGVEPGAVTPFGILNDEGCDVAVVIDEAVLAGETVCCHPLVNSQTTAIRARDLLSFFEALGHRPEVVRFEPTEG